MEERKILKNLNEVIEEINNENQEETNKKQKEKIVYINNRIDEAIKYCYKNKIDVFSLIDILKILGKDFEIDIFDYMITNILDGKGIEYIFMKKDLILNISDNLSKNDMMIQCLHFKRDLCKDKIYKCFASVGTLIISIGFLFLLNDFLKFEGKSVHFVITAFIYITGFVVFIYGIVIASELVKRELLKNTIKNINIKKSINK